MPKSIALQRIAKQRVGARPIATSYGLTNLQSPYVFPAGSKTWPAPASGHWKFIAWGAGGQDVSGGNGGGSGAYVEITKILMRGQAVSVVVGVGNSTTDTKLTFPDGTIATAGRASGATGGTATITGNLSNSDVLLNGTTGGAGAGGAGAGTGGGAAGSGAASGCGAPANLPFYGGDGSSTGVNASASSGRSPGGGASADNGPAGFKGGDGLVLAYLVRE
jgi:hypothetical protein